MNRVLISVEGQTEETFVKDVLAKHLLDFGVSIIPVIVTTKRVKQGNKFKGGLISYGQAKNEIRRLLLDTHAIVITTMYDYYQIPEDFPGYHSRPAHDCYARVRHVEMAMQADLGHPRFIPYLQLHEFETFLFVNPALTAATLYSGVDQTDEISQIRHQFATPEEINEGITSAPSKRILSLFPGYEKPLYGTLVALSLGMHTLKQECNHFRSWVAQLEALGQHPQPI